MQTHLRLHGGELVDLLQILSQSAVNVVPHTRSDGKKFCPTQLEFDIQKANRLQNMAAHGTFRIKNNNITGVNDVFGFVDRAQKRAIQQIH